MREKIEKALRKTRVVAILRGLDGPAALAVARALWEGGVSLVEVTFDQARPNSLEDTARAIAAIKTELEGRVLPGAGTVMDERQVALAAGAGAAYIISPGADEAVIRATRRAGLVSMPGAATPSEAACAHAWGADYVKLFPAGALGPDYLRAIRAPLSHVRFLAVGGIGEANAAEFIAAGAVGLGVGGSFTKLAAADDYGEVTASARRLIAAAGGEGMG